MIEQIEIGPLVSGKPVNGKPGQRQSEPKNWYPTQKGGIGLVTRRSSRNGTSLLTADGIERLALYSPQQLLRELPAAHPSVGLAQWNALRLMWPKDGWGFRVYTPIDETLAEGADAGTGKPDKKGDKSIKDFVKQLPREIGGLKGLATTLTISLLYDGMACLEGVPSDGVDTPFGGLRRLWPVDPLTIGFGRPDRNADLQPYQKQQWPTADRQAVGTYIWTDMWQPLDVTRFFWTAIDQTVDDPFGLPPYGTAANEVLADLALMRDLRDAVHNAAWPRMKVGVNLSELHKVAVEVYRITDPKKAALWVQERFNQVVTYVQDLLPDDNIVCDTSGETESHAPGSFSGLEGVLEFLRQRLVQALKSLPTLMGINDGSYNYTSVEWAIYAAGLEALRDIVMDLMADAFNLHLRLQGNTSVVTPWAENLRTNDALVEANTTEVRIRNAATQEALGYITHDEGAESITKRKAVKEADPDVLRSAAGAGIKSDKDGSREEGNAGQGGRNKGNNEGATPEERKTSENKKS